MTARTVHTMSVEELEGFFVHSDDGEPAQKRIRALVKRLHEANQRAAQLEEQIATDATEVEAKIAAAREEAALEARTVTEADWTAKLAEKDEQLGLSALGIHDEDTIHLLRRDYARLPEEDRPALADYAKQLKTDEKAREGKSPALLAGLGIEKGGAPSLSAGAGKPGEIDANAIREAFAKASSDPNAIQQLISRMPSA
jgi:hypothetical protein